MYKNSFFFALLFLFSTTVFGQSKDAEKVYSTKAGAIQGYDPVAYFIEGMPVEGKPDITFKWKDAEWHFATAENKAMFEENPEKFAPQYGGYCAYGWTKGYAAKTDPDAWSVVNGKLYLNYNADVQKTWNENRTEFIQKADENYAKKQAKN